MTKQSTTETERFVYRHPFKQGGKWRVRRRDKLTGKVVMITLKSENVSESRQEVQRLAQRERDGEHGAVDVLRQENVSKAISRWLSTVDVRADTKEGYKRVTNLLVKFFGKDTLIAELGFEDIEELFSIQWVDKSGATKIRYRGILVRWLTWCSDHGLCPSNIGEKIKIQKSWRREATRAVQTTGKALSIEQAKQLLSACDNECLWWFVFISLRTGLRRSNILGNEHKPGLLWTNIDIENGVLSISEDYMKNDLPLHVPIHDELWDRLKTLNKNNERVIPGNAKELKKAFDTASKRAELGKIFGVSPRTKKVQFRIHDLRHTFAAWVGEHCTDAIKQILLGHAGNTVTGKYGQIKDMGVLRQGVNKLEWLEEKIYKL
jgi:integrase